MTAPPTTVVVCDINGFSAFTDRVMAERGDAAADAIAACLESGLGAAAAVAEKHGFSIDDTLGDGFIASCSGARTPPPDALTIERQIAEAFEAQAPGLTLRAGLGTGEVRRLIFDTPDAGTLPLTGGPAVARALEAMEISSPRPRPGPGAEYRGITRHFDLQAGRIRRMAVLFARLDPGFLDGGEQTKELAGLVWGFAACATRQGARLAKLTHDGKGLLARFEIADAPGGRSLDDEAHLLARELSRRARGKASFGLASGRVFDGLVRLSRFSGRNIYGECINAAAKLSARPAVGKLLSPASAEIDLGTPGYAERRQPERILTGRASDRTAFRDLVGQALATGGVVLIEGEAGIGKSALLTSLDADAWGARRLLAACHPASLADPLAIWREIASGILTGDGDAAAMRYRLSPPADAEFALLFQAATPTEAIERDGGGERLATAGRAIATLLKRAAPAIVIVDDAQWLGDAGLRLLRNIISESPNVALVLARRTNAGEQVSPAESLPGLPVLGHLKLGPLPPTDALALLCDVSGVAEANPAVPAILPLAAGNPFRLVQAAHWLKERSSTQIQLGTDTGDTALQLMLQNRLDRLEPALFETLGWLSVWDDEADEQVIKIRSEVAAADLDRLEEGGFLTRSPFTSRWAIGHRLLAEAVIRALPDSRIRALHRVAARRKSQQAVPGSSPALISAARARHWRLSGDAGRGSLEFAKAAELAMRNGAYESAIAFYEEALALVRRPEGDSSRAPIGWRAGLASAQWALGRVADAFGATSAAVRACDNKLAPRFLAGTKFGSAIAFARRTGLGVPALARRMTPRRLHRALLDASVIRAETAQFSGRPGVILSSLSTSLALAGRSQASETLSARAFAFLGFATGLLRLGSLAERFFAMGRNGAPRGLTFALAGEAVWHLSFGRWAAADRLLGEALACTEMPSDSHQLEIVLALQGLSAHFQGKNTESCAIFRDLRLRASARGNALHIAWGLYAEAQSLIAGGEWAMAKILLPEALELASGTGDRQSQMICLGLLARTSLAAGQADDAIRWAQDAGELAAVIGPTNFSSLEGYAAAAQTPLLIAWLENGKRKKRSPLTAKGMKSLAAFARVFPIGQPRLLFCRAMDAQLGTNDRAAARLRASAEALARKLSMTNEIRLFDQFALGGRARASLEFEGG